VALHDLLILTEYETGHAITAIEWVARGGKPIIEIGGRVLSAEKIESLSDDLNRCIDIAGESEVYGFVLRDGDWWRFGFYRYEWAIAGLLHLFGEAPAIHGTHAHWIRGLLFGYSSDSIHRFISSECDGQESTSHSHPYRKIRVYRRVEIYDTPEQPAPLRSSQNGKFRTLD
jgi:hypothetical protein